MDNLAKRAEKALKRVKIVITQKGKKKKTIFKNSIEELATHLRENEIYGTVKLVLNKEEIPAKSVEALLEHLTEEKIIEPVKEVVKPEKKGK